MVTSTPVRWPALPRDPLAFELRVLVDVAGAERRVLVRRRMLDVSVHADGAAVHDAFRTRPRRGLDDLADRCRVHGAIGRRRDTCLAIDRGDVVDDVDVFERRLDRGPIAEIAHRDVQPAASRSRARSRSRTRTRTLSPRASKPRARCPPVKPVAPVTRTHRAPFGEHRHRRCKHARKTQTAQHAFGHLRATRRPEESVEADREGRNADPSTEARNPFFSNAARELAVKKHPVRLARRPAKRVVGPARTATEAARGFSPTGSRRPPDSRHAAHLVDATCHRGVCISTRELTTTSNDRSGNVSA